MFSFFSTLKVKKVLFAGLVLFVLTGILSGCDVNGEDDTNVQGSLPNGLLGKWVDYDYFVITRSGSTETIKYDGGGWGDYEGTIKYVSNYDSRSGLIIVQYTTGTPDAAKPFHAIYYLDLSGETVSLNNTWDAADANYSADAATLEEAIGKFTKGSMGNYIDVSMSQTYNRED